MRAEAGATVRTAADAGTRVAQTGGPQAPDIAAIGDLRSVPFAFWCFLGAMLCNVFAGQTDTMGLPLPPDRLLFPAAIVLALLDPRVRRPPWRAAYTLMALFAAVCTFSALLDGSAPGAAALFALTDRVVMPFLLFGCAPLLLATSVQRLLLLRTITLLGAYLAVTAIAQTAGATNLVFPAYIVSAQANANITETFRAGGPFLSGEANGMALAMCACLALLLAAISRGGWRVAGLAVGFLDIAASVLSMTRSVWLGVALGAVLVVAMERRLWRRVPHILAVLAGIAAIGLAMLPQIITSITARGATSRSLFDRANTNAAALRAISDNPVLGVGWARFVDDGSQWVRQADAYPLTTVHIEVHNVVLSRAAELGVPAALLYVLCLVAGPGLALLSRRRGSDPWHSAVAAIAVVWLVPAMTSPIPYTFPTFLAFTVAGWLFARERRDEPPPTGAAHAAPAESGTLARRLDRAAPDS